MALTNRITEISAEVFGGVDTHKDVHVAAALNNVGVVIETASFDTTPAGYAQLLNWLKSFGEVLKVGVEGTGSWGAGLSRFLQHNSVEVVEVNCPNRQNRRRKGKSDTTDAIAAAKALLSGDATAQPKSADGLVESIRLLRIPLRSALNARTQAANQIHSIIDTAPDDLRQQWRNKSITVICKVASCYRPVGKAGCPTTAANTALGILARRWLELTQEIKELRAQLTTLVKQAAPALVETYGVGTDTVGALLVTMGDNPQRCRTEAGFAALCGASPMDASSGKQQRHRLSRGGDRIANNALWRIVIVRLRRDPETQAYLAKRLSEGKTKREAIRCLKRHVARQIWKIMNPVQRLEAQRPTAA